MLFNFQSLLKSVKLGVVIFLMTAVPAFAQSSTERDLSIDQALLQDPSNAGMLPATGGAPLGMTAPGAVPAKAPAALWSTRNLIQGQATFDKQDQKAKIYEITGDVKIAQGSGQSWEKAERGMILRNGALLLTGKESTASIAFDESYLNVVYIPENTKAEFVSIEPTDIHLEDGRIYSILDGLDKDTRWKITTPVAVAAVRGTYYLINFLAADGSIMAATFEVPNDGHESFVKFIEVLPDGKSGKDLDIPEGNQIDLKEGESPDPSLFHEIDQKWLEEIQEFLERLAEYRRRSGGALPPTGGELLDPGVLDPGTNPGTLDPTLDTNSILEDDSSSSEDESSSDSDDSKDEYENEDPEYDEEYYNNR